MRELKFRLFDKADGIHFMSDKMSYFDGYLPENDATAVMQYTGLKDKNGKCIYDGDIVKIFNEFDDFFTIHKVRFGCANGSVYPAFNLLPDIGSDMNCFSYIYECLSDGVIEVIGNIYENPELIQDKK